MTETLINTKPWPLNITFTGLGELSPQEDITPKESVHLCAMLACAMCGSHVDNVAHADEHGLRRHFK